MNNYEWLINMTYEQREEWLKAEHVESNDDLSNENVVRPQAVDTNDGKAISGNLGKSQNFEIDEPDTTRNELEDNGYVVMPYHNGEKQAKLLGKEFDQVIFDELQDSREKLEADVRQILHSAYMLAWMHGRENRRGSSFEKLHVEFYNMLDRQAAITERECRQREYAEGDVYRKVYTKSHIDEMIRDAKIELDLQRDRNAELQEALDQQRAATANANDLWGRTRDELAAVKAEREAYRNLFGKSLDLADEIRALGADCDTGVAR